MRVLQSVWAGAVGGVLAVFMTSCGGPDIPRRGPSHGLGSQNVTKNDNGNPNAADGVDSSGTSSLDSGAALMNVDVETVHPKIFIPGWGPARVTNMDDVRDYFVADGVDASDIYQVNYPYKDSLAVMTADLVAGIKKILATYPAGIKVDIVTHSLGSFVAFNAIVNGGFADNVRKVISLAGVINGQNRKPRLCSVPLLRRNCSDVYDILTPVQSPAIKKFLAANAKTLAKLDKCSIYSPDDGLLDPYDAGKFPDGKNIEVPGIKHLQFIHSADVYDALKSGCFAGNVE